MPVHKRSRQVSVTTCGWHPFKGLAVHEKACGWHPERKRKRHVDGRKEKAYGWHSFNGLAVDDKVCIDRVQDAGSSSTACAPRHTHTRTHTHMHTHTHTCTHTRVHTHSHSECNIGTHRSNLRLHASRCIQAGSTRLYSLVCGAGAVTCTQF